MFLIKLNIAFYRSYNLQTHNKIDFFFLFACILLLHNSIVLFAKRLKALKRY